MGSLFGFVVGYVLGARVGNKGFDDVIQAVKDVRDSEEFSALLEVTRTHAVATLSELSRRLAGEGPTGPGGGGPTPGSTVTDLVARARARAEQDD